jgi:flagellar basal-body rod protein FlgC
MNLIAGLEVTAGALDAQKTRLDLVAQNIANAQTTRTPDGGPYQRRVVAFETQLLQAMNGAGAAETVRVGAITTDPTPGQRVYNPQHPDADGSGFVTMPNVNLPYEMVDLLTASRAFEANLSFAKSARQMAEKTLEIGK